MFLLIMEGCGKTVMAEHMRIILGGMALEGRGVDVSILLNALGDFKVNVETAIPSPSKPLDSTREKQMKKEQKLAMRRIRGCNK